jgi:uncharacterized caspase-like protein
MQHWNLIARNAARTAIGAVAFLLLTAATHAQDALNGVALIIGQSKYEHIPALPNPSNDARAMAKLLTDLGFDARSVSDRDAGKLKRDLERFVEDAEGADVAFLYYSGHGIESGGENWLIPVDADVSSLDDASEALVAISSVVNELKDIVPVTIVLLDACRTNPFPANALVRKEPGGEATPIGSGGLTPVRGAAALKAEPKAADNLGMVIGFAAEPGQPALDGDVGGNSPYAAALLRHLGAMNGVEFGAVMRMVTEEVYLDTKAKQRPWVNESLRRMLYFGVAQDEPTGDDALITGERRKLLLTISELPTANRAQVELVASRDAVPLDSLYGVLRAMGTEQIPEDPNELSKMLDQQAARLKDMFDRARALDTDDPETRKLLASADVAIREGAIETARDFLDDAVGRVEQNEQNVDDIEEEVRKKRIADAAVYAQRADVAALAYDFAAAAADYRKAFELVEKWDEKLRWNYKNMEAEALHALGDATGDEAASFAAIDAYKVLLGYVPYGEENRDWAITRNNMAVVLQTLGERSSDSTKLEEALEIFRASLAVFDRERDDVNWAAAQNNIGNVLLVLGGRQADPAQIKAAVEAFRASLTRRDRSKVPLDWASSQNSIGLALVSLAERSGDAALVAEADAAYAAALEEYNRATAPAEWAMVQNNLGNAYNLLGDLKGDPATLERAVQAYSAALEVRTQEHMPMRWAMTKLNLGNVYNNLGKLETGTDSLWKADEAYRAALTVYTRERSPLDWAAVQNNLGSVLRTLGQRSGNYLKIGEAVEAYRAAQEVYTPAALPLDWAMANLNIGNSLNLIGSMTDDPVKLQEAADAFAAVIEIYKRETHPYQWALAQASLGTSLQSLARFQSDTKMLHQAVEARRAALTVLTKDSAPIDWANAQNGLGTCLLNLSNFEQDAKYLPEAKAAFEATLLVFTKDYQPVQWAFAVNNVGDVHWSMGARGGGKPDFEKALANFEVARAYFDSAGYPQIVSLMDDKIKLIKDGLK